MKLDTDAGETARLADQLRRTMDGDAWHGPSVLELLDGISAAQAHAHPIRGAHSIWEIVLHLHANYGVVLRRIGGESVSLAEHEDWPAPGEPTPERWREAVAALRAINEHTRETVARFDVKALDQPLVPRPPYPAYAQFIGLSQHDCYHAGQVALLLRALQQPTGDRA